MKPKHRSVAPNRQGAANCTFAAAHRRIAINRFAATLISAAAFSVAIASSDASTVPSQTALLAIL
jgi:hypothetical protein